MTERDGKRGGRRKNEDHGAPELVNQDCLGGTPVRPQQAVRSVNAPTATDLAGGKAPLGINGEPFENRLDRLREVVPVATMTQVGSVSLFHCCVPLLPRSFRSGIGWKSPQCRQHQVIAGGR